MKEGKEKGGGESERGEEEASWMHMTQSRALERVREREGGRGNGREGGRERGREGKRGRE